MDQANDVVFVEFTKCSYGWIYFKVKAGGYEVHIRASEVFDPFPDLIAWMEAVTVGVQECAFDMEEEGPEKRFEYRKINYKKFRFRITDNYEEILLEAFVDSKQLVSAFYNSLKGYASSDEYQKNKSEWEDELLWERMSMAGNPPVRREVVLQYLLQQKREKIIEVFFKFASFVCISFPDAKDKGEEILRYAEYVMKPEDTETKQGLVETPQYWPIPEDFDAWTLDKRGQYLEECLDENVNGTKCGTRLSNIHSTIIDQFLKDRAG